MTVEKNLQDLEAVIKSSNTGLGAQPLPSTRHNFSDGRKSEHRMPEKTSQSIRLGKFIVIDGVDHSGKTTQCELLKKDLADHVGPASIMRFPDRTTPIGKLIDNYLKSSWDVSDEVIHLLFCANRWEQAGAIKHALDAGIHIVCDRYVYSGIAFSAAKGLDLKWCEAADIGLPEPDLTIFLELPDGVAEKRQGYGDERYETTEFQRKVAEIMKKIDVPNSYRVSAVGTVEDVALQIHNIVFGKLQL